LAVGGALCTGFGATVTLGFAGRLATPGADVPGAVPGLCAESGVIGLAPLMGGPPAFGAPTTGGTFAVGPLGVPAAPGAVPGGSVAPCCAGGVPVLALGLTTDGAPVAALGGGGGAPFAPGTGSALAFGNGWVWDGAFGGRFTGGGAFAAAPPLAPGLPGAAGLPGAPGVPSAPGAPGFTAVLIEALGGAGSLPCWISVAFCATEGGSAGLAALGATTGMPALVPTWPAGDPGATGASGGRLMTVSITLLLWMLA
jgi:hypothetical protein